MNRYVIHNLTQRQLSVLWYALYTLREYVKGDQYREMMFGSDKEIEELQLRALHREAEDDDTKTTT